MKSQNLLTSTQFHESLPQTSLHRKPLTNQFNRLWQVLVRFATTTQEPKITWRRDRQGQAYLEVYDSYTGKHHYFDSEQDARIWLDRDRFQQPDTSEELLEKIMLRILNSYERY